MLSSISWGRFGAVILSLTALYYSFVFLTYYRKTIIRWLRSKAGLVILFLVTSNLLYAQDGKQGINQANDMLRSFYDPAIQLLYAIGALFGLIGAVRVFQAFNQGEHSEARQRAAAWFGGCIFLVIVATVIRSFFGI